MILFLDTSALVKLYISETGSEALRERIEDTVAAVSQLTYGETHATFARRLREGLLSGDEFHSLRDAFETTWTRLTKISFSSEVLEHVPRICAQHPLRGADAMQLACACMLKAERVDILFATSDRQLAAAGKSEGIAVFDPQGA